MFSTILKDFSGQVCSEDDFIKLLKSYQDDNFSLYIGTDSKLLRDKVIIVSSICFHKDGQSGKIFYLKEKIDARKYRNLRSRMLLEAYKSLEVAMILDQYYSNPIEIHLDIGTTIKSKTSAYETELTSLIQSQGYLCAVKPDSWASFCSDRILKGFRSN